MFESELFVHVQIFAPSLENLFVTQTIALHNMADEGNEMSASCSNTFILGIDIGTTSIKANLLSHNTREVIESVRRETNANISDKNTSFVEQDVRKILSVLQHAQLLVNCHHNSLPE